MITRTPQSPAARRRILREEVDQASRAERIRALRSLLRNPLLLPHGATKDSFARVRRHSEFLRQWFAHHLGWSLVCTAETIRLRKIPADTTVSRPATDAKSGENFTRERYALFCIALAVLERCDRQVTLGRLVEQMRVTLSAQALFAEQGVTLETGRQSDRRNLVHVLRLLLAHGVLRRMQGDETQYVQNQEADVLYNIERSVLAALLSTPRSPSLLEDRLGNEAPHEALLDEILPDTLEGRNRAIRLRLARHLVDEPVLYYEDLNDEERIYLDRQRPFLLRELEEATGLVAEIRKEGIALTDLQGDLTDFALPEEGTDGHLTLLLATWLADRLRRRSDCELSLDQVIDRTARFIREHEKHWRKDVSEPGAEKILTEKVLERLSGLNLIRRTSHGIKPRPAIGRYALRATPDGIETQDLLLK